jgi:FkbM family methyltransferase
MKKMRKVFLDIGAHTGQSFHQFYRENKDAADWQVYCFEPLFNNPLEKTTFEFSIVQWVRAAVGVENGLVEIFPVPDGGQGATTQKGKTTGDVLYDKPVTVDCIDLVKWFGDYIRDDDFVIVKMNIEGGEYALMPRLPEILPKIAGMHIKLHHNKFNAEEKAKLLAIYHEFQAQIDEQFYIFVLCDPTEGPYDFEYLVEQAHVKQNK